MTTDALWTCFVRAWRNLMFRWCQTCRVFVHPDDPFIEPGNWAHYHGDWFD